MGLFNILLLYSCLIIASLFYLIYCISPHNQTRGKILGFVFESIPKSLMKVGNFFFGRRFQQTISAIKDYLFFSNNSLIMIFYLCIAPGSYFLYVFVIMIPYYEIINKVNLILGNLIVWIGFYFYYKTCATDPGTITPENHFHYFRKYEKFIDDKIYYDNYFCRTCDFKKPARSKHCSLCNKCISKHDHHCVWIKGCIGEKNYKYFVAFLFTHALFCAFGFLIFLEVLISIF